MQDARAWFRVRADNLVTALAAITIPQGLTGLSSIAALEVDGGHPAQPLSGLAGLNEGLKEALLWAITILVCAVLWLLAVFAIGDPVRRPMLILMAVVSGVVVGLGLQYVFPATWITAFVGTALGSGGSQVVTGEGVVSKLTAVVTPIATQIGVIVDPAEPSKDPFITTLVWFFLGSLALMCALAFRGVQVQAHQNNAPAHPPHVVAHPPASLLNPMRGRKPTISPMSSGTRASTVVGDDLALKSGSGDRTRQSGRAQTLAEVE